ncbi:hypothetical protein N9O31_03020 [Gammaproteobacteria bacterium]|nr:hypothetical protein [Gammaproteobacteria bacterium]
MNKIFPATADNHFKGYKISLWGFIAFMILMTWRSIIHMLFEQHGVHEIANFSVISGDPDPMLVIYRFFSLWGFAQLIFCLVCWVVIFRYKSLIPFMYLLWLFEWSFRTFGYPLIREDIALQGIYTVGVTPGVVGAPFITFILVILFILSLIQKKNNLGKIL